MDRSDIITDMDDPRRCEPGEVERLRDRIKELEVENKRLIDKYESGPDPVYTMSRIDSQFGG